MDNTFDTAIVVHDHYEAQQVAGRGIKFLYLTNSGDVLGLRSPSYKQVFVRDTRSYETSILLVYLKERGFKIKYN